MQILSLLASFPERGFSLSEIARATAVNPASCHAVVSELEQGGFLCRDVARKSYTLGPALVAFGSAAMLASPLLRRAGDVAGRLRDALDLPVLLTTVIGEEIACILSLPDRDGRTAGLRAGDRVPFLPPVGVSFVAWSAPEQVEHWIARRFEPGREAAAQGLRDAMAQTRAQGFHVTLSSPEQADIASVLLDLAAGGGAPDLRGRMAAFVRSLDVRALQPDLSDGRARHALRLIAAPVFHPQTRTTYNLCLGGFAEPLAGPEIARLGQRLIDACLEVMRDQDQQARRA